MNLGWLLAPKVVALAKWEAILVSHEDARRLCEGIEIGWIVVIRHLLLHLLLYMIFLAIVALRMLADSAARLAPRVATVLLSRWEHYLLLLLLIFPVV
jgi:hypothetical protein